jgi:hypothetical protein
MQQSQTRQPQQQTSGLKTLGTIAGVAVVALVLWFANDASKPKLFAKVDVIRGKTLRVANANDAAWRLGSQRDSRVGAR